MPAGGAMEIPTVSVLTLGLNHATAPLALREQFAFPSTGLVPQLGRLQARLQQARPQAAAGVAILSTCNRTELYLASARSGLDAALQWLVEAGASDAATLRRHSYVLEDGEAARHVFRVASGLDSMVLGEPQVLGQMKQAARLAAEAGTLGSTLHQLFQRSFAVAKQVRSRTELGRHPVSFAAVAVRLAERLFEDLPAQRVLCIGAGEMVALAATHFAAQRPQEIAIASRSEARARTLAERVQGRVLPLAEVGEVLHRYDVVITGTASSLPILGLGAVERALAQRRRRPMLLVDLAVPRDIEPEVARLEDAYLYCVDDLAAFTRAGAEQRQGAVVHAEAIVEEGVVDFVHWLDRRGAVPLIRAVQGQVESWRAAEIERAQRRLRAGEAADEVLEAMSRSLASKLMHGAWAELRSGDAAQRASTERVLSKLFLDAREAR